MKPIKLTLWGLLAVLTLLWITQPGAIPRDWNFFGLRHVLTDYTGIVAMGAMSVIMIIATKAQWFENWLDGLDKSYRLHKWLGITALVTSVIHWAIVSSPGWAMDLGLLEPRQRHGPPDGEMETGINSMEALFGSLRDPAEGLGEKAFYIGVILMVVALIPRISYKRFFQTHFILAIAYLVLVFHSVVLMPFELWSHPLGWIMGALMFAGTVSAVLILARRHGKSRISKGVISKLIHHPSMRTLITSVKLDERWNGHKAGQFAFVTFDDKEGKHPFTIASTWNKKSRELTFMIKELGDHTAKLPHQLKEGDEVIVEGPYGRFTFEDSKDRQIWVSGGIGITPFIAGLKERANGGSQQMVDLFHVTPAITPEMEEQLRADAKAANIDLHLIIDQKGTAFNADLLRKKVPNWKEASVWFCGPAAMGQALKDQLEKTGLNGSNFHQELFDMR